MKSSQFYKLKKGDKVRIGKNGIIRKILKVGIIDEKTYCIILKRVNNDYQHPHYKTTVYCSSDSKIFTKVR